MEHKLGWRAQFAYPKSLFLPPDAIPFTLTETDARLKILIAFGADIFVLRDGESIRLWGHAIGYDADGLDYIINLRRIARKNIVLNKQNMRWECDGKSELVS